MSDSAAVPLLSDGYEQARQRLTALLLDAGADTAGRPVPACPGWTVRDVVAHLVAIAVDAVAGRLTGPPSDAQTAEQVARYADQPLDELLRDWAEAAPEFETGIDAFQIWPAVIDALTHEQDIRGAIGAPGARDTPALRAAAEYLVAELDPPSPVRVVIERSETHCGPEAGAAVELRTTHFEAFRWRLGRRSRAQLRDLDWSTDPGGLIDHLVIFGPATTDIVE